MDARGFEPRTSACKTDVFPLTLCSHATDGLHPSLNLCLYRPEHHYCSMTPVRCGEEGIRTLICLLAKQVPYLSCHFPKTAFLPHIGPISGRSSQRRPLLQVRESNPPSQLAVDLQSTPLPLRDNLQCLIVTLAGRDLNPMGECFTDSSANPLHRPVAGGALASPRKWLMRPVTNCLVLPAMFCYCRDSQNRTDHTSPYERLRTPCLVITKASTFFLIYQLDRGGTAENPDLSGRRESNSRYVVGNEV